MFKVTGRLSHGESYVGRVQVVYRLRVLYHGICLTSEENTRKNLEVMQPTLIIYRPPLSHFTYPIHFIFLDVTNGTTG